ncbi:MAG TPA: T9SS type A sorting domain-containing protein [Bacteroidia bacterium]|nr:T9SS type A sorting domain-containing protein [Bacteroidia bacterium]
MKKLLLSIFVIITVFSAKAQFNVYHPFPDSNAYWGEESQTNTGLGGSVYTDFGYKLSGDTIWNGRTYHKVYEVGGMSTSGPVKPYSRFFGGIRDSMKRIYGFSYIGIYRGDTLYYDFNLKVGDTLHQFDSPVYNGISSTPEINYVYKIDSVLLDGNYRKEFVIATDVNKSPSIVTQIIEGIGSMTGLYEPMGFIEGKNTLLCFQQNGYVMFSSNGYFYRDTCIVFGPVGVNEINNDVHVFNIYPNPANTSATISYQLDKTNAVLKLYNTMGQLLKSRTISNSNGTINEDVSILPGGVYYYTLLVDGVVEATQKLVIMR